MMINNISIPGVQLWKYIDNITISESVVKNQLSRIQAAVDEFCDKTKADKFQLNEIKCKELRIDFSKSDKGFNAVNVNDTNLEVVNHAKLLGLNLSRDRKWNIHISEIIKKAASRLYFLRQLKRSKVACKELIQLYITCITPVTKYACQVYHNSLPNYLSNDLEQLQECAMCIIHRKCSYAEALNEAGLQLLSERHQSIMSQFFEQITKDKNHRLHPLLLEEKVLNYSLRKISKFVLPKCIMKCCQSILLITIQDFTILNKYKLCIM